MRGHDGLSRALSRAELCGARAQTAAALNGAADTVECTLAPLRSVATG